jgi:flagellar transcriptional activator FlhC
MEQTALAVRLIKLDARLQLLEAELCLSREILLIMYREIRGESPPKGMLPFADEWYFTWQPCIHSSLFMAYHQFYESSRELSPLECLIRAYEKYIQEISRHRNYIEGGGCCVYHSCLDDVKEDEWERPVTSIDYMYTMRG